MNLILPNWKPEYDGRYVGLNNNYKIELRIDSSLNIISGDLSILFINKDPDSPYYNQTISEYYFSFICTEPEIKEENQVIIINGNVAFFKNMRISGYITVNIDHKNLLTVNLEFKDKLYNIKTTSTFFELKKVSKCFRDINVEVDVMRGTRELPIYKDYSFINAFAKAGINLKESINEIKIFDLPDETWDDSELHSIMNIFMQKDEVFVYPRWYLYLLIATLYVYEDALGIMYDSTDEVPRQGAAVFAKNESIDGEDLQHKRTYLFTIIHELGHAFNLHHSFVKGISTATGIPKPESLSFMNYPHLYPLGLNMPDNEDMRRRASNEFWSEFENKFSFDDDELAYIRHHDLYEVIMGGNSFESGDRYEYDRNFFDFNNRRKNYDLLVRTVKENFEFGEPIMTEVRIKNMSNDFITIPQNLNIKDQFVIASIEGPDGTKKLYQPMIRRCLYSHGKNLQPSKGEYEDLFLHYGSPGFYFKTPGRYKIQALVPSLEGILKSKSCEINVLEPQSKKESKIINSTFSRDYGHYIYLKGADHLEEIEKKLNKLKAELGNANFSRYIDLYRGERLSREFKDIRNGKLEIRRPSSKEATISLNSAIKETRDDEIPFQNVTLNRTMNKLAKMYDKIGEHVKANDIRSKLVNRLKERNVMKEVIQDIEKQMKK